MAITSSVTGETGTRDEGRHLGVALLVIATAQLMVVLDTTFKVSMTSDNGADLGKRWTR